MITTTSDTSVREDAGNVTVCAMVQSSELEGLQENITISVSFTLEREGTSTQGMKTFTNDLRCMCFNFTIPDNDIFEDDSTLTVMVTSDKPRVMITNGGIIQINIQDNDGIPCN